MKTYYQQMKPYVDQVVKSYKDDFYKYDKSALDDGINDFLWAIRETGTNILRLDPEYYEDVTLDNWKSAKESAQSIICGVLDNERFFHGQHGILTEITKQEAGRVIDFRFDIIKTELVREKRELDRIESERQHRISEARQKLYASV